MLVANALASAAEASASMDERRPSVASTTRPLLRPVALERLVQDPRSASSMASRESFCGAAVAPEVPLVLGRY